MKWYQRQIYCRVKHNAKTPVDNNWQNNPKTLTEAKEWINSGGNIGVIYDKVTGLSCLDIDNPSEFEAITKLNLDKLSSETLSIITSKGCHLIYQYQKGLQNIPQAILGWGDFLYSKRQGLIPPSVVDGVRRDYICKKNPISIPQEILSILKSSTSTRLQSSITAPTQLEPICVPKNRIPKIPLANGVRNVTLTSIAGALKKVLEPQHLVSTMQILNRYLSEPITQKEITAMTKSIIKYKEADMKGLTQFIMDTLVDPMPIKTLYEITKKEGFETSYHYIQIAIERLIKNHTITKISRGVYQAVKEKRVGTLSDIKFDGKTYTNLPFNLDKIADIYPNSIIMLASKAGKGKTHIFAYCVKQFLRQGIPVAYWDMENELPAIKNILTKYINPDLLSNPKLFSINIDEDIDIETLRISPDRINFIDPIYSINGWGDIDIIMRNIKKQLNGGLCFIATHLKDVDDKIFGGQTAMKVPSIVLKLKHQDGDRMQPYIEIKKVRNWKAGCRARKIQCKWDDTLGIIDPRFV